LANREWLIDPINILIDAANEGVIESGLAVGDVTLVATNNIDLNTIIDWSTGSTFQLDAVLTVVQMRLVRVLLYLMLAIILGLMLARLAWLQIQVTLL